MPRSLRYVVLFTILSSILLTPMTTAAQKPGLVRHVVVFKYKKDAAPDKIAQVTRAFRDLRGKIPGITAFEDGILERFAATMKGYRSQSKREQLLAQVVATAAA